MCCFCKNSAYRLDHKSASAEWQGVAENIHAILSDDVIVISDNLFQITLYTLVGTQGHNGQCTDRGAIFENQCTHQQMGH